VTYWPFLFPVKVLAVLSILKISCYFHIILYTLLLLLFCIYHYHKW
jgi:hypothetical protein